MGAGQRSAVDVKLSLMLSTMSGCFQGRRSEEALDGRWHRSAGVRRPWHGASAWPVSRYPIRPLLAGWPRGFFNPTSVGCPPMANCLEERPFPESALVSGSATNAHASQRPTWVHIPAWARGSDFTSEELGEAGEAPPWEKKRADRWSQE